MLRGSHVLWLGSGSFRNFIKKKYEILINLLLM